MKKIRICKSCGSYTLAAGHCGVRSASAHPPPYNPNDTYGAYRRRAKGLETI